MISFYTDWRAYLKEDEIATLVAIDGNRAAAIIERKRIRDRCYQRARRAKEGQG